MSLFLIVSSCRSVSDSQIEQPAKAKIPESASEPTRDWQPAKLNGLVMGKATITEMQNVFGRYEKEESFDKDGANPKASKRPAMETWYYYNNPPNQFPGRLILVVEKPLNRVKTARLETKTLPLTEVISKLGPQFIKTQYDFEPCLGDDEDGPIYESPQGPLRYVEYRSLGIAVRLEGENVSEIIYVSTPIGAAVSKCKK
jgi:hypothetical protein